MACHLQAAQPDGFIPHIILWQQELQAAATRDFKIVLAHPYHTATTQPPVLVRAVLAVVDKVRDYSWFTEVLPATQRYYARLGAERDRDGDGLASIVQPDESGLDCSPKFDAALGIDPAASD